MKETIAFLKNSIAETLGEELKAEITMEASLESLGLNSLSFMSVVVKTEDEYDIEFEDDKLANSFKNVIELAEYVEKLKNFK